MYCLTVIQPSRHDYDKIKYLFMIIQRVPIADIFIFEYVCYEYDISMYSELD